MRLELTQRFVYESVMPNKFRNLFEFMAFTCEEIFKKISKRVVFKHNLQTRPLYKSIFYKYSVLERTLNNECRIFSNL